MIMISLVLIMILFGLIITVLFQSRHVRFADVEFLWIWQSFPHPDSLFVRFYNFVAYVETACQNIILIIIMHSKR